MSVNPLADVLAGEWYAPYVQVAIENGIVSSFGNFNASRNVTRGEFVDMVYRAM
ncbi:MAG: hypothetical protein COV68_10260 [Nitrospirae bacterium CG11_big_fil_rev_8_21_14_0_20_41_14]|nr:MAG: hypothetical protein COV68_10260 [Nitrospirae bacterium CG11_big_fil_rev_8_21_14_0_20_41_14]